ncbi:hypothetical protein [Paenibacillus anaericanus]|uniref:hypothetical protein n=1 Tax=Paenibacillus anaericanus TaxID=170367 RepID=UPI001477552D|nr:hypothetical protein [Paenibacillus anaericanus]
MIKKIRLILLCFIILQCSLFEGISYGQIAEAQNINDLQNIGIRSTYAYAEKYTVEFGESIKNTLSL